MRFLQGRHQRAKKPFRLTLTHQPPHGSFGVARGGIDQNPVHRLGVLAQIAVDTLSKRGTPVAAVKAHLINQTVRKAVQQDKGRRDAARGLAAENPKVVVIRQQTPYALCATAVSQPLLDRVPAKFQKDALTANEDGWQPVDPSVEGKTLYPPRGVVRIWWQQAGEPCQGPCLTELLDQPDSSEEAPQIWTYCCGLKEIHEKLRLRTAPWCEQGCVLLAPILFFIPLRPDVQPVQPPLGHRQ